MKNMTWTKEKFAGRLNRVFGPWQIALIGIVVNNAIVLVDTINLLRRETSMALRAAVAGAVSGMGGFVAGWPPLGGLVPIAAPIAAGGGEEGGRDCPCPGSQP